MGSHRKEWLVPGFGISRKPTTWPGREPASVVQIRNSEPCKPSGCEQNAVFHAEHQTVITRCNIATGQSPFPANPSLKPE